MFRLHYSFSILIYVFVTSMYSQSDTAERLYATGNYTKAISAFKACNSCDTAERNSKIAKAYNALGNYNKALEYYDLATNTKPENELINYEHAKLLFRLKRYDKAKQKFQTLILTDSLNPNFHYQLGLLLEKQKDSTALHKFKTVFTLDSTHQKAIFKIAKQHIKKRRFKMAHQFIDKGLTNYADNVELISLKAQAYYHQEFYTKAVTWFKRLIALGERSEFIHEKLSISYAKNSDYEDAIYHRKQALKYNPFDARAMYVIGNYYERLSNFEKAEDYISKSLKLMDQPLNSEYTKLGTVLNRQLKYKQAITAFQKALKEDPSDVMTEFFLLRTKDEFYADTATKIKLYESFIKKHNKHPLLPLAQRRLKELKEKQFLDKN